LGEYHSFVSAGPMLKDRVPVAVGETIERDGFAYCDLVRAGSEPIPRCRSF
jgi:hypothetical protein